MSNSIADLLGINHEEWIDGAICSQTDPGSFFVGKGGNTKPAKTICAQCPVSRECLEYALVHDERFGVWGGLSERERRKLKRATRPPTPTGHCGTRYGYDKHCRRGEQACPACRAAAADHAREKRARKTHRGGAA
jgi:WhiB family redox-sensing transcriptional regulator